MSQDSIEQKKQIIKLRKNIKEKLLALKIGKSESDREFKETYQQLLNPINSIAEHVNGKETRIKNTVKNKIKQELKQDDYKIENKQEYKEEESDDDDDQEFKEAYDTSADLNILNDLQNHIKDTKDQHFSNKYDHVFGIKYDSDTKKLRLGTEEIKIQGKDIILKGQSFDGTTGLYNLLFLKDPKHFTKDDNLHYISMLKLSKVIYLNNDPTQRIKGNASKKYMEIIKPFFTDKVGKGIKLLKVENKPYRAIYWDDVNELVHRLFLLHASKNAGNNSVQNEIIAIEEELKEAKIIK